MRLTQLIPGMPEEHADLLWQRQIRNTSKLLYEFADFRKREGFSLILKIPVSQLLSYANAADFHRIPGIGFRYIQLLREIGCDTVRDLGTRNAENLHKVMYASNTKSSMVLVLPSLSGVRGWITRANKITKVITYR